MTAEVVLWVISGIAWAVVFIVLRSINRAHQHEWSEWSPWIEDMHGYQTVGALRFKACDCGVTHEQRAARHHCVSPHHCPHIAILNETAVQRMERDLGLGDPP